MTTGDVYMHTKFQNLLFMTMFYVIMLHIFIKFSVLHTVDPQPSLIRLLRLSELGNYYSVKVFC